MEIPTAAVPFTSVQRTPRQHGLPHSNNYNGFGSGLVVPRPRISLHNRGYNFHLTRILTTVLRRANARITPLSPVFSPKTAKRLGPFGVMGAFVQPQGHVQVLENLIDFGLNPQEALDAPRWQWTGNKSILLEPGFPSEVIKRWNAKGMTSALQRNPSALAAGR